MDWQKDTGRYIARQVPQQAFQQSLAITKSDFRVVNHYAIPTVLLLTRFHFCPIQMFQEMIIRKLTLISSALLMPDLLHHQPIAFVGALCPQHGGSP